MGRSRKAMTVSILASCSQDSTFLTIKRTCRAWSLAGCSRWHLLKNLREMLQRVVNTNPKAMTQIVNQARQPHVQAVKQQPRMRLEHTVNHSTSAFKRFFLRSAQSTVLPRDWVSADGWSVRVSRTKHQPIGSSASEFPVSSIRSRSTYSHIG